MTLELVVAIVSLLTAIMTAIVSFRTDKLVQETRMQLKKFAFIDEQTGEIQ